MLVGIGVAAFAQAGISYVLTEGRIFEVAQAYVWLVGSLNGRGWEQVLAARGGARGARARCCSRSAAALDVLALGDDVARGARRWASSARGWLLLAAGGRAHRRSPSPRAGPIGVRRVRRAAHRPAARPARRRAQGLLAARGRCGAVLVLVADLAGRLLFAPHEIPVGIVTSILAAPYFLCLLRAQRRSGG